MFCRKGVLKISQNSQENTSGSVSFLIKFFKSTLLKKEILGLVLSCDFYGIFKSTCFAEHLRTAVPVFGFTQQFTDEIIVA